MSTPVIQPAIRLRSFVVQEMHMTVSESVSSSPEQIEPDLKFDINQNLGLPQDSAQSFIVLFEVSIGSEKTSAVSVKVRAYAEFETNFDVDSTQGNLPLLKVNAPAIAFPFLRSYIHTVTANSGIPPIILPAINFSPKKA